MRSWKPALGIVAVLSLVAGFVVPHDPDHVMMWWDEIGVFYGAYGFLGCLAIIFVSKLLGKLVLQRREDYYDDV